MQYREEYRTVGGIEQYLLHYPAGRAAPVLLFVHGGPGMAESCLGYQYRRWWGDSFTVVYWEQRGAGKTLERNRRKKQEPVTLAQMLDDLDAVAEILRREYGVRQIALLGHSWGSLLASLYALRRPAGVSLYIGVGQTVYVPQSEAIARERLRREVAESGTPRQKRQWERLAAAGAYPRPGATFAETLPATRKTRALMGSIGLAMRLDWPLVKAVLQSPTFGLAELKMFFGTGQRINRALMQEIWECDLRRHGLRYEMPVYYILGERDFQAATPLAEEYFGSLAAPKKELYILAGAGHNTMFDAPQAFARALRAAADAIAAS